MAKFKIADTEKHLTEFFEVEADTKKEALEKYVNELAGSLEQLDSNYNPDIEDGISVTEIL